jgi:dethiobiotin synthetase
MVPIIFITGTDTSVGKTVLTALLVRFLRARGVHAAALKPICSGGREDARIIYAAMDGPLTLDEINPWHFRAAIAPSLAAQLEKRSVKLLHVVARIRTMQKKSTPLLVEGAGGLLSPLGEDFDSRDLIVALRATPIIVAPNKLGAVNHLLLTLEALPKKSRAKTKVVLMSPAEPDAATNSNKKLLAKFFPEERIFTLSWLGKNFTPTEVLKNPQVTRTLRALAAL